MPHHGIMARKLYVTTKMRMQAYAFEYFFLRGELIVLFQWQVCVAVCVSKRINES